MNWLEEFLKKFKSAEVIDDPVKIASMLEDRTVKQQATVGASLHTRFVKDEDDSFQIKKQTGVTCTRSGPEVPTGNELTKLFKKRNIPFEDGFEERIIPYWASDERVDSYGDIVKANWIFDEFKVNPIIPFSHRWRDLPVGNSLMEQVVDRKDGIGKQKYEGRALWLLVFFASEEQSEFADSVFRLVKGGLLRSGSVGFWSEKVIDVKDEDERAELGLGRFGFILDKNHLLEYSPVLLPANTGAFSLLSKAKQASLLVPGDFKTIRELYRQEIAEENAKDCKERWGELDANLKVMSKSLFSDAEWIPHKELDVPLIEYKTETEAKDEDESTIIHIRLPKTSEQNTDTIERLEEKLDSLLALHEEVLLAQGRMIEDIREGVEEIKNLVELQSLELQDDPDYSEGESNIEKLLRLCSKSQETANSA